MTNVKKATQSEVTQSELTQSELTQSELTQSELTQSELTQSELTQSELTQSEATRSEISQKADPDLLAQIDRKETERAEYLRNLFGTDDPIFADGLWRQLEKASFSNGKFSEGTLRFLASIVAGVEPRDPLEAMLLTQMALIQKAVFDQSLKLALSPDDDDTEILSNMMKLTRIYTMQLEALKRHRSKPEQQLVQNVMVAQGGQAIVGPVHHQQREDAGVTPAALTHSSERPVRRRTDVPKEVVMVKQNTRK
jgi:hypothetical protein